MENTLFTKAAFEDLKKNIAVSRKERIVIDTTFFFDGKSFDGEDLLDTLEEIENEDDIAVTNISMAAFLMKNGIISSAGSLRWCTRAEKGPNFDEFIKFVRDEMFPPAAGTDKAF
jgi:hypothetical protein